MAAINLTAKVVASLIAAGDAGQFYDEKQTGLVLRVRGKGRASWSTVYTGAEGKRQRVTLKGADAASLDAARAAARRIIADAHAGQDAAETKRRDKKALTLAALVDAYFDAKKLRSADHTRPMLTAHVIPALGSKRADQIGRGDIALLLDKIAGGTDERKAAPASANRVYDDLKAIFSWALDREFVDAHPMLRLARPARKQARERVLSIAEMQTIFAKLPEAPWTEAMGRIIKLLALTGCRASEISELRKSEVDLDAPTITLPAGRTKNARQFIVPLSPAAVAVLREAIKDAPDLEFVFPSPRDWAKPIDGHAVSTAVRRAQTHFSLPAFVAHDFRRAIATGLSEHGVQPHVIELVLNHVSGGVTRKHYNLATYAAEHRQALEKWAKLVAG